MLRDKTRGGGNSRGIWPSPALEYPALPVWLLRLFYFAHLHTQTTSSCPSLAMPPPTSTQKPNKAAAKETPAKAPAAASNGAKDVATGSEEKRGSTKPDQAKYNAEQDEINKEIAAVKAKMVSRYVGYVTWC